MYSMCKRDAWAAIAHCVAYKRSAHMRAGGYIISAHEDIMGSASFYTKPDGSVYEEHIYDAWGGVMWSTGHGVNDGKTLVIEPNYTGHSYDPILKIYHAEARFYDAKTRQWMESDPIKSGLNWYAYVESNPTTYFDPNGLEKQLIGQSDDEDDDDDRDDDSKKPSSHPQKSNPLPPQRPMIPSTVEQMPSYVGNYLSYYYQSMKYNFTNANMAKKAEMLGIPTVKEVKKFTSDGLESTKNYFYQMGCKLNGKSLVDISGGLETYPVGGNQARAFWGDLKLLEWDYGINLIDSSLGVVDSKIEIGEEGAWYLKVGAVKGDVGAGLSLSQQGVSARATILNFAVGYDDGKRDRTLSLDIGGIGIALGQSDKGLKFGASYIAGLFYESNKITPKK